jgi:hypothetical protein
MLRTLELLCSSFPGFTALAVTACAVWGAVSLDAPANLRSAPMEAVGSLSATCAAPERCTPLAPLLWVVSVGRSDARC